MARFETTPPTDPLPRAEMTLPEQAERPADFAPDVPAEPPLVIPVEAGAPEGLPSIPTVDQPESFPEPFPEDADEALLHLPWA